MSRLMRMASLRQLRQTSPAFYRAVLESEKKRIIALVVFVLFFTILKAVRIFVFGSAMSRWGLLAAGLLIAFELVLLWSVLRALRFGGAISDTMWYCGTVLESLFPAMGIALFVGTNLPQDYRPLATPWVLFYYPLILLSVLRLNPWLCVLSGVISTLGYVVAAYSWGWRLPEPGRFSVTETAVVYFALILLATGIMAAGVAFEFREQVSSALREAEMQHQLKQVQHELQIARSIQQSLLPRVLPQIPGFAVAGWSKSADDTGGDFYDWKRLADGRWVVFLADVTGHGIGPAILASVCRAYSRANLTGRDNLGTALKNINDAFAEDLTPERFATFVATVLQGDSGHVELLSAGHAPLFLYSARDRSVQFMDAQVLPLGIVPELDGVIPVDLRLQPGDMVLLVTDGFFEWENPLLEQFGKQRLAEVLQRYSHQEPDVIIAEIYNAVLSFSQGTPQKDDLTAVLIKCMATQSESVELESSRKQTNPATFGSVLEPSS